MRFFQSAVGTLQEKILLILSSLVFSISIYRSMVYLKQVNFTYVKIKNPQKK